MNEQNQRDSIMSMARGAFEERVDTIEELAITYKGRLLTPVHFGMTPKAPPRGKSYTLKASVMRWTR